MANANVWSQKSFAFFSYRQVCESNDYIICYSLPCLCICEQLYKLFVLMNLHQECSLSEIYIDDVVNSIIRGNHLSRCKAPSILSKQKAMWTEKCRLERNMLNQLQIRRNSCCTYIKRHTFCSFMNDPSVQ